jgi:hypothetical protein
MAITYVKLKAGGLEGNIRALYPDKSNEEIARITNVVYVANADRLNLPYTYKVGTEIQIDENIVNPKKKKIEDDNTRGESPIG